jgi:hypothetical protein
MRGEVQQVDGENCGRNFMISSYKYVQNDQIRELAVGGLCNTNESLYKILIGKPEGKRPKNLCYLGGRHGLSWLRTD